jgi:dTDP-4-dehydrorhamnose reductase
MRIAVIGAGGMLGSMLCRKIVAEGHDLCALSLEDLDITCLEATRRIIGAAGADWVLNAAAYTNVDKAEMEPLEAYRVNALGTRNVAVAAREAGSRLLYYSTDYVFNGRSARPYREWDDIDPIGEYGHSKRAGEEFVRWHCPDHIIIRTSWLFGPNGVNFVSKILDRSTTQERLQVVNDQRGSPTYTADLAAMTLHMIGRELRGTYHVTNSGECTWYEFAAEILRIRKVTVEMLPVSSSVFASPAPRPAYSVLDNFLLELEGIPLLRNWREALVEFLEEP